MAKESRHSRLSEHKKGQFCFCDHEIIAYDRPCLSIGHVIDFNNMLWLCTVVVALHIAFQSIVSTANDCVEGNNLYYYSAFD